MREHGPSHLTPQRAFLITEIVLYFSLQTKAWQMIAWKSLASPRGRLLWLDELKSIFKPHCFAYPLMSNITKSGPWDYPRKKPKHLKRGFASGVANAFYFHLFLVVAEINACIQHLNNIYYVIKFIGTCV